MPQETIRNANHLIGKVELPADKSVAHRAAIFAALSEGESEVVNYPDSEDPQSTLTCLRQLGVDIVATDRGVTVSGVGLDGLKAPDGPLDCGNSGTTMRLLAGVLAGQSFDSELVGDSSLSRRPMTRIAEPLRKMGARVTLTDGLPPIRIGAVEAPLQPIEYELPVASAQVKSAVLLAGLYAAGETVVIESTPSRDHTERMLQLETFTVGSERRITVKGGKEIAARTWAVPKDFSAAAFFLAAGATVPKSRIMLRAVGVNPTRSGALDILTAMGARISVSKERQFGGEPIADLHVQTSSLTSVRIDGTIIPNLIDEIPVLAVAATAAAGETEIRDASELRVKESDRIAILVENLRRMGADIDEHPDGMTVRGGTTLNGAAVESHGDHRIAMALAVAGLLAEGETRIDGAEAASVSFPNFWDELRKLAGQ